MEKKCPKKCVACGSTKIKIIEEELKCSKCGFINSFKKKAQIVEFKKV